MSIKGVPLFGPFPQYKPSPQLAQEINQLAISNAPPSAWEAIGAQVKTENVNGVPITWIILPSSSSSKSQGMKIQGYVPGGGY